MALPVIICPDAKRTRTLSAIAAVLSAFPSLVTLKPAAGVTWDSFSTCPYCGGTFFKQIGTNHKGEAEVTTTNYEV